MENGKTICRESLQEQVANLKRKVAGQKGRLVQFGQKYEEMKSKLAELQSVNELQNEKIREQDLEIKRAKQALNNAKGEASVYKANYEYFKTLPWYKRIFCKF